MDEQLPHDGYMTAVADHLAVYGITVTDGGTSENGDLLDGWITIHPSSLDGDQWPHGVILGWDQQLGWTLIEQGGGRNVHSLDPSGVRTFSSPQQVAYSAQAALRGRMSVGPITNDGSWSWDPRPLQAAITAWETDDGDSVDNLLHDSNAAMTRDLGQVLDVEAGLADIINRSNDNKEK